jgi:D-alanyl-D-alanine dipeptidase
MAFKAIPNLKPVTGWREVPVIDNGEKLVAISELSSIKIKISSEYFNCKIPGSIMEIYVRESVAAGLVLASHLLTSNNSLLIWDGWRPLQVQKSLFDSYKEIFRKEKSLLSEEELILFTQTFVSLPSSDSSMPSPHYTGGSVDLTITDSQGLLNMGTKFDEFTSRASTRYFEEQELKSLSREDMEAMENRRMLFDIMSFAGFSNYSEEWWHFDFGNQFWAKCLHKNKAIYSGIELYSLIAESRST